LAGTGEKVVGSIMKMTRSFHQVVGGAAGDEGGFQKTWVGSVARTPAKSADDSAVALHVFSASPIGVGVDHGLRPSTPKMVVTRAEGNVVHELDNRPAFDAYKDYARARGVALTRENAGPFLINNELGVFF